MSDVRTDPLTPEEIASYHEQGFLFPIRVLDDAQVEELREALDDHLEGRRQSADLRADRPDRRLEPRGHGDRRLRHGDRGARGDGGRRSSRTRCRSCSTSGSATSASGRSSPNPVIAGMARQLLGSEEVVLMEDGAVIKKPVVGGKLAWHQDYAYWPLASPGAVTCWIALDDVGAANGAHAGRRRARTSSARSCRSSSATAARSCTTSGPASSEVHDARGGRARGRSATSSRPASAASTTR